ncbi:hypothetical protein T492DRAFT_854311 [Pavlovales sp. CCMP2436]|nr:hypothetical protein T492DRAFT_854311 [Pavlovales sp. CCMP2436]
MLGNGMENSPGLTKRFAALTAASDEIVKDEHLNLPITPACSSEGLLDELTKLEIGDEEKAERDVHLKFADINVQVEDLKRQLDQYNTKADKKLDELARLARVPAEQASSSM